MAVFQATGMPAVSLPNGARSLPVEVLWTFAHLTSSVLLMSMLRVCMVRLSSAVWRPCHHQLLPWFERFETMYVVRAHRHAETTADGLRHLTSMFVCDTAPADTCGVTTTPLARKARIASQKNSGLDAAPSCCQYEPTAALKAHFPRCVHVLPVPVPVPVPVAGGWWVCNCHARAFACLWHHACMCVSFPQDANDALRQGWDLKDILTTAKPVPHEQIATFDDLRDEVFREVLDPQVFSGTEYQWLPSLQTILKGHRRGEMSIITGTTGAGKTTLLSQISLDLCSQVPNAVWIGLCVSQSQGREKQGSVAPFAATPLLPLNA